MRYVSFMDSGVSAWGALTEDGGIVKGNRICGTCPDLRSYIEVGFPDSHLFLDMKPDLAMEDAVLEPVIPNPSKIVMAALNYFEEGDDRSNPPAYPVLFLRLPSSQIGHRAPLVKPRVSEKLDFEGELAVIIGKPGRHIARGDAMAHVAGYSIYNDGSVRDWQKHSHQFTPGKNFQGTGAFGPCMVTADEISLSGGGLSLVTRVNGVEKQRTDTSRMIFDVPYLVSYISTFTVLNAGDVIVTGTCKGFGSTRTPQEFLSAGDVVDVEIEGIGVLSNPVEDEAG
ncbi:fumarylacetoacetate hydrolase family protein [Oricola thermophila]|uniref:Fumarylacetoacetate hydrolase family protein n=1 Tax=Oricola thermophila TaxID=2742145 RepID=A0A6N1VLR3_9HYPH|nr:fumarylacetoacetate hydrolase family protein [Oricola thermophila]QKV20159.1 fumarylacetoacetate hydrolase family protein [Oricola thermophila]